jgi:Tol biopolymer transport system component
MSRIAFLGAVVGTALAAQDSRTASRPESRPIVADGEDVVAFMRDGGLFVVRPDGSDERRISAHDFAYDRPIAWDAAGGRIFCWLRPEGWDVGAVDVRTGAVANLTRRGDDCRMARSSRDGRFVAFLSGAEGLCVTDADGGDRRTIAGFGHRDAAPEWSPDGLLIAWTDLRSLDDRRVALDVWIVAAEGGKPAPLARDAEFPQWSADGREAFVVAARDGRRDVYAVAVDGSRERPITRDADRESALAVSPDGRRLAFVADRAASASRPAGSELAVVGVDGADRRTAAALCGRTAPPSWSPDGARLAFASVPEGADEASPPSLFVVETSSGAVRWATRAAARFPTWRPRPSRAEDRARPGR